MSETTESSAVLLDPREPADAARIADLSADPAVQVLDHLQGQQRELAKLMPSVAADVLNEPTRWAWYPWRRTLVRVLGPGAFRLVRLDRNRNKITREEQARFADYKIGVVGLSVGHAIAHTLALQGLAGVLRLADFDEIEISNLNRIPATVLDLGVNKAVVVARRIAELDPYLRVEVITAGLTEATMAEFVEGLDLVIEECDSLDMKLRVREAARAAGIALIMETSDRGLLDIERYDIEPDRPLFHGLLGSTTAADLRGLSTHDKVPHVLRILEPDQLSARMAASMTEVDVTVATWPQLGGDVTLGAASVAAAVTRLGRGAPLSSGRTRIDLEAILDGIADPSQLPAHSAQDSALGTVDDGQWLEVPADAHQAVAHAAALAPSGGNTQPWKLRLEEGALRIDVEPARTSRMDVQYRGSYVAMGAALFNARVTAAALDVLGPSSVSGSTAVLRFGTASDPTLAALRPAVLTRSSNRHLGGGGALEDSALVALSEAVAAEEATLRIITDQGSLTEAGELIGESDRIRFLTEVLHREMMSELRWPGRDDLTWGLDVRTLELDSSDLAKLGVARRADVMSYLEEWHVGRALGDSSRERIESSRALAVVTIGGSTPADFIQGGQALEHMWLTAQDLGVAVHPMSPVFLYALEAGDFESLSPAHAQDLTQLSARFRGLMGVPDDEVCVLVMRLSRAPAATVRSRRIALSTQLAH
jgi:hypothetical protein